jgi:hypothetical protein
VATFAPVDLRKPAVVSEVFFVVLAIGSFFSRFDFLCWADPGFGAKDEDWFVACTGAIWEVAQL